LKLEITMLEDVPLSDCDSSVANGYQPIAETSDPALKSAYWKAAIGLQQVDGLEPSEYLLRLAERNIDGELSYADVHTELRRYYAAAEHDETTADHDVTAARVSASATVPAPASETTAGNEAGAAQARGTREADVVSARIAEMLDTFPFWFSIDTLAAIHERLFFGLYENAGRFRSYDIMKAEPILGERSVTYAAHGLIVRLLQRFLDDELERSFSYAHPLHGEQLAAFSRFTADVWHVHPFDEGNTRTTAVFVILYLHSLGYQVDNSLFEKHSRYYRDALVRASYFNIRLGVERTDSFLENFYDKLLNGATHPLDPQALTVEQLL
jgi:fido (protein-threonine AMPylation protein)